MQSLKVKIMKLVQVSRNLADSSGSGIEESGPMSLTLSWTSSLSGTSGGESGSTAKTKEKISECKYIVF